MEEELMRCAWEAHSKGYEDQKAGKIKASNPYPNRVNSLMFDHWDDGFEHAKSNKPCIDCPVKVVLFSAPAVEYLDKIYDRDEVGH